MPICPACRTGYNSTEARCPKCGAAKPAHQISDYPSLTDSRDYPSLNGPGPGGWSNPSGRRCGTFAYVCLHFAQVAAFLGVLASPCYAAVALFHGATFHALLYLFILTPISIGTVVAFGLALKYARYE